MSIIDERRHALLKKMEPTLGPDDTATLMEIIEKSRWSDGATKADLERFATKDDLDQRLERFATKDDLHVLTKSLITWMFAGQATLVAMVGILVSFAV